jgi:acyl-CoA reductase-like NAD-dependent aldehyde dehydrogenase
MSHFEVAVKNFKVENPANESAEMGPLVSATQLERVKEYVPDNANVAFRGTKPEGPGYWFAPTVLEVKDVNDRAYREEIFGPVVSVITFEDEADAIRIANDSEYGLSGSIWTRDIGKAVRVSRAVEAGNLSVNSNSSVRYWTPFGGYKQSGLGRELGPDALDAFTETKNVFFDTNS